MGKYANIRAEHSATKKQYSDIIPEMMPSLAGVSKAIVKSDILDEKTMEMVFIGCAISRHCIPCIASHVLAFIKAGGTREELVAIIGITIAMGGGPDANYATNALEAFDEFTEEGIQ